ncbi:MAG TPA: hypothetical protein VG186_13775 [Solirubrobacteraceae bacterium]|nr:hypothetical protein [Solirubrobacteraceae bacterium]
MSHPSKVYLAATVAAIVAVAALLARVGADAQWLAALGHVIAQRHSIPSGIPFAAAPTSHWPDATVLAQLIFNGLEQALGDRGLILAQLLAVAGAFTVLARDALAGGANVRGTSRVLLLVALGAVAALTIARVQMFSLVLFPVTVALLRDQARRPSRRIWLVVPLLALWANLHGTVLLGLAVVLAYLVCSRARREPILALSVGVACTVALCLTPALTGTVAYYHGLLTNVAAQSGQGMWGPLSLTSPLDLLLIAAAITLSVRAIRARPPLWEWAVLVALAVLTVQASRNGVWLLFFIAGPASRAIAPTRARWPALVGPVAVASIAVIALAVARGPASNGATPALLARAMTLAHGSPMLAEDIIAEQIALDGGRIWVGNPIDAFSRRDQTVYLDWLDGQAAGRQALAPQVRVVLVSRGSPAQALMAATPGFTAVGGDARTRLYERQG